MHTALSPFAGRCRRDFPVLAQGHVILFRLDLDRDGLQIRVIRQFLFLEDDLFHLAGGHNSLFPVLDALFVKIDADEAVLKHGTDTETDGEVFVHAGDIDSAGHGVAGALCSNKLDIIAFLFVLAALLDVFAAFSPARVASSET